MSVAARVIGIVDVRTCMDAGRSPGVVVNDALRMGIRVFLLRGAGTSAQEREAVDLAAIRAQITTLGGVFLRHGRDFPHDESDGIHWNSSVLHDSSQTSGSYSATSGSRFSSFEFTSEFTSGSRFSTSGGCFGFSTHSRVELTLAAERGAAWATLSPFEASTSKPGYGPALGVEGLREICAGCTIPVFALAGVTASTVVGIGQAKVAGVAVMGMLTSADRERAVAALLNAMERESWLVQPPWSLSAQG